MTVIDSRRLHDEWVASKLKATPEPATLYDLPLLPAGMRFMDVLDRRSPGAYLARQREEQQ